MFDLLHSSSSLPKKAACLCCDFGCEVHQTHTGRLALTRKQTHKDARSGRFFPAFWRHCRWPQRHSIIHQQTATHTHTQTHMSCSAPNQSMLHFSRRSTAVNILRLHTKNCVYFHLEFQPVNGILLKNLTLQCAWWRGWLAEWIYLT